MERFYRGQLVGSSGSALKPSTQYLAGFTQIRIPTYDLDLATNEDYDVFYVDSIIDATFTVTMRKSGPKVGLAVIFKGNQIFACGVAYSFESGCSFSALQRLNDGTEITAPAEIEKLFQDSDYYVIKLYNEADISSGKVATMKFIYNYRSGDVSTVRYLIMSYDGTWPKIEFYDSETSHAGYAHATDYIVCGNAVVQSGIDQIKSVVRDATQQIEKLTVDMQTMKSEVEDDIKQLNEGLIGSFISG